MRTPEEKFKTMREQVIAKILWGTDPNEVRGWLYEKDVDEQTADILIREAAALKRHAVRQKARWGLVFSIIGLFLTGLCLYVRLGSTDSYFKMRPVALGGAIVFGLVSVPMFFRNLMQLVSGERRGTVD
jgi:hypothetical protein